MLATSIFTTQSIFGIMGPLLVIIGIFVLAYAYSKANTTKVWRETAEGYKALMEQLRAELVIATDRISTLEKMVAELKGKTDVSSVFEAVAAGNEKLAQTTATIAEKLSQQNEAIAEKLVASTELIAAQLSVVTETRADDLAAKIEPKSTAAQVEGLSQKLTDKIEPKATKKQVADLDKKLDT